MTFHWGLDQQLAVETLRWRLCEAPILALSEVLDEFVVYCDAFITGLGVVVMKMGQ